MNYLLFKNKYPKSCALFFNWLEEQKKIEPTYVDNAWFYKFFREFFNSGIRHFKIINQDKISALINQFPNNFKPKENVLYFDLDSEDDYDILFKCLEILIEKKLV